MNTGLEVMRCECDKDHTVCDLLIFVCVSSQYAFSLNTVYVINNYVLKT